MSPTSRISYFVLMGLLATCGSSAYAAAPAESPAEVVSRWLELHRTGKTEEETKLVVGDAAHHRAGLLLLEGRDFGTRVAQSLGNDHVAAVITTRRTKFDDDSDVFLFWLARRDGVWKITKSDELEVRVVEDRVRGFFEAGDVRWHVLRGQLAGHWESGPCHAPGAQGIVCGSRLILRDDNRFRIGYWGPGGPPADDIGNHVQEGTWRVADGGLTLTAKGQAWDCQIVWLGSDRFEIESADGKIRADYHRTNVVLP